MRRHWRELLWVGLGLAPLLAGLDNEIQEPDPAQYAEVARRIHASGDLVHLSDTAGAFLNKPPLTLWLIALAIRMLGETSVAVRLPTLLAGVVLLFAVAQIGRALWDTRTGIWAAALLASSLSFQLMVADPKVDMVVSCLMALTVWLALEARQRRWALWPAWLCAGLGVLTKGPIGLCAPAAAVLPEALRRKWGSPALEPPGNLLSRLVTLRPIRGLALVALVLAPYYWGVLQEHGSGGPWFLLWEQSFGRLFHLSGYRNQTGPFFFLHTALWAFLPFLPPLLYQAVRSALTLFRTRSLPHDEGRVVWWWLLLPLAAISLAEFKLPQYLYWLAAPAALIAARAIASASPRALTALGRIAIALAFLITSAAIGVLLFVFPGHSTSANAGWLAALLALLGGGWWLAWKRPPPERLVGLCAASVLALNVFFELHLHPELTRYQPGKEIGQLARREEPEGKSLPFVFTGATNAIAFYAGRKAVEMSPGELAVKVRAGETRLAVTDPRLLQQLRAEGLEVRPLLELRSYPTTTPRGDFLNPRTRAGVGEPLVLVRVEVPPQPGPPDP